MFMDQSVKLEFFEMFLFDKNATDLFGSLWMGIVIKLVAVVLQSLLELIQSMPVKSTCST